MSRFRIAFQSGELRSRFVGTRGRATPTVCSRNDVSDRVLYRRGRRQRVDRECAEHTPGGTGPSMG